MRNKFFNEDEFTYTLKTIETDPYTAEERIKRYLEKYPRDYYARAYYVIILTIVCKIDEATEEYNKIISDVTNDKFFDVVSKNYKKYKAFKFNMVIARMKILAAKDKYQELYDFFLENYAILDIGYKNTIGYTCEIKLGMLKPSDIPSRPYRLNQTIDYSEERFFEHIKHHLPNSDEDKENAVFKDDFPIKEVVAEIKKLIPSSERTMRGIFDDTYCFRYDNCGTVANNRTNYFIAVAFHNTSDLITIYPALNCERLHYIDLNHLVKEDTDIKVKKISQVEKFNKRYNLK